MDTTVEKQLEEQQGQDTIRVEVMRDKVLVQPIRALEYSPGGVYLPHVARDPVWHGVVVACGRDTLEDVHVGMPVVFHGLQGQEVWIEGQLFILHTLDGILAEVTSFHEPMVTA